MKRVVLLASIAIMLLTSSCSNNKIDGIFELKLGMTEDQLREVVDISLLKEKDLTKRIEKQIITKENGFKKFHLDHYVSEDDHILEDITLSFFDDKLYDININKYNSDIEKLLIAKYGKPKIEKEESTKPRNKDSLTTMYYYWKTNDSNIVCWSFVHYFPDRSIFMYSLYINDQRINELLEKLDKDKDT